MSLLEEVSLLEDLCSWEWAVHPWQRTSSEVELKGKGERGPGMKDKEKPKSCHT